MLSMRSLARPSILLRKIPTDSDHLVRQTFSATAGNMSRVSEAIIQDHKELKDHYARIMTSSDQDELTRYQNAFVWELARHSIGEELALYPAFEEFVSNGKAMADKDRQEHLAVCPRLVKATDRSSALGPYCGRTKAAGQGDGHANDVIISVGQRSAVQVSETERRHARFQANLKEPHGRPVSAYQGGGGPRPPRTRTGHNRRQVSRLGLKFRAHQDVRTDA
ncbi:hypothetical protein VTK73DRAFT_1233 [Phialemonium thermophilum]|uniref:Hemerythrin-like domain-containing protein n=1 Tax=Phialemonium thermophilum TaxID=223376 RepID=A0ABR3Y342_9PEZI